jgi:hypothetical protein
MKILVIFNKYKFFCNSRISDHVKKIVVEKSWSEMVITCTYPNETRKIIFEEVMEDKAVIYTVGFKLNKYIKNELETNNNIIKEIDVENLFNGN